MGIFWKQNAYWIDFVYNGRRKREKVGPSKKLAQEALTKRKNEIAEARYFPERFVNSRPFRYVVERYEQLHGVNLRSHSWSYILKEFREEFGGKKMGELTTADIQRHYNAVIQRASVSTANRHMTLMKSIFNKAKLWGYFSGENPCNGIKRQREPNHRLRYLSADEMARLIELAHPRIRSFLLCALFTGMRRGEILGLDWANVNLERGVISILQSKSGKARYIQMGSRLRQMFEEMGPRPGGFVFDVPCISLRRYFARALRDAGIPTSGPDKVTLHTLRHSFASHFIMKTNNLTALQNILGHSSYAMTLRYAHLGAGHLKSEMEIFESAIPRMATDTLMTPRPEQETPYAQIALV